MVCERFVRRKNCHWTTQNSKMYTHICCSIYSILYIIGNRRDPYSVTVIKSLLHFYANIIHSYAVIMTPDANYCVVL